MPGRRAQGHQPADRSARPAHHLGRRRDRRRLLQPRRRQNLEAFEARRQGTQRRLHGVALAAGPRARLLVTTPDGIGAAATKASHGRCTAFRVSPSATRYICRGVALKPGDPDTIFVGNGDFIPGKRGAIQRSQDGGASWEACKLPVEPNSVIYWFGTNVANPDVVVANSLHGYVYLSTDAGTGRSCAASSAKSALWRGYRTEFASCGNSARRALT